MVETYHLNWAAAIDIGRIRSNQEDHFAVLRGFCGEPLTSSAQLFAVADGLGGHPAGAAASHLAIEALMEYFNALPDYANLVDTRAPFLLTDAFMFANRVLADYAKAYPEAAGLGTTLVAACILPPVMHLAWLGDSRCYLLRPGASLHLLSHDHSFHQQMLDLGIDDDDQNNSKVLVKCLGDFHIPHVPECRSLSLGAGDRLLFCTDGLNRMALDTLIERLLGQGTPQEAANALVAAANEAGGVDNVTALVVEICPSLRSE